VFANSVLGARTARYGDFVDVPAALTGRVPLAGLHLTANRQARIQFELSGFTAAMLTEELTYALLGAVVGSRSGTEVPVITGAPRLDEDALKALGAAAASTASVGLSTSSARHRRRRRWRPPPRATRRARSCRLARPTWSRRGWRCQLAASAG
jgi:predicted aconitase